MAAITKNRIESLDLLKGLVIVIMALDHTRDYFHYPAYFFDPTDPLHTSIPVFFTRFITNFCAPAFSFLAGLSAFMVGKRKTLNELSAFLLKRGLWLVFVEVVLINFGWHFDPAYRQFTFQVIWVLGLSMIILAALIYLPRTLLFILSCVVIFGHNLLDGVHFEGSILWSFIHERKAYPGILGHNIGVGYPIIPWFAVMSLGYCFGTFYDKTYDPASRRKLFNLIGIGSIVLFLVLRIINGYGNLLPWQGYGSIIQTLYSFFNVTKYPPSLDYLLVTLGPALLFLANSEAWKGGIVNFFTVFGRVPFFFYIIHIYLIHFLAVIAVQLTFGSWQKMILPLMPAKVTALRGYGFSLVIVYIIWIAVIAFLYLLCKKFDAYKQNHKDKWWLSYL
jgi:uncharacterized membrane protein